MFTISGNPATPAFIPFGVRLELAVAPLLPSVPVLLPVLATAVLEVLLDALLAATGEALGELSSSATAMDGIEVGAVKAVELDDTAPGGP